MTNTRPVPEVCNVVWSEANDSVLVLALLRDDRAAWREFWRRYDGSIRQRISAHLCSYSALRSSDTAEEIKAEFYEALLTNDKQRLRQYSPQLASLSVWLRLIADQVATKHMLRVARDLKRVEPVDFDALDAAEPDGASPLLDALHGVRLLGADESSRIIYAWFGGPRIHVYDPNGQEQRSFPIRRGGKYPSERQARRAIKADRTGSFAF